MTAPSILFLGVEGSGKTSLAMALVRAFARHRADGWYLRPVDRGAYTFATLAPEDFARDGFPRQTANVREMSWRLERDGKEIGALEILDYPGEVYRLAFLNADDEPDPAAFRERAAAHETEIAHLREALAATARVFVLFNLQDALDLRHNDANRGAVWVTNESLKAVKALPHHPALTLVFTQVDRYQTYDDFLHTFTPADLDLIGHDHPDVDWAMVSVLMEPAGEFGIDAFVRRCTGLADFGVSNGRPHAAVVPGDALRRLEAAQKRAPEPPVPAPPPEPSKPAPARPAVPPAAETPKALRVLLLLVFALACGVAVFVHLRAAATRAANDVTRGAVRLVPATTNAPAAVVANAPTAASQRLAKRLGTAAWSAWMKAEAARAHAAEAAARKLAQALAAPSPQAAHELLCEAAEAGNAEAQEELARVYDIWGWGGWVRTAEERGAPWRDWLRRIDVAPGAKAVCVSRPAPNAEDFRKLAQDWYRAAAANGRATAADALARHALRAAPATTNATEALK